MGNIIAAPKRILIGHGDKGGVGKSLFTRLLLQYHHDRNFPIDAYDTDEKVGDLKRFYKDLVQTCSLKDSSTIGPVLDRLMDDDAAPDSALIDVAGGSGDEVADWLFNSLAINAAESGHLGIVIFFLIGSTSSSLALLKDNIRTLGNKVTWVVVQNHFFTRNFDHYYDDAELQKLLLPVEAYEYKLSPLDQKVAQRLDGEAWTFAEGRKLLSFTPRGYLGSWLAEQYGLLDQMAPQLGIKLQNDGPVQISGRPNVIPAAANG